MPNPANQLEIANALKPILAETVQLYMLTQNVHWNIVGPLFQSIHTLTEVQYTELALSVDLIAERIRMLGSKAPGSMSAYQKLGAIKDGDENAAPAVMIKALMDANTLIAGHIRPAIGKATDAGDDVTVGLLTDRLAAHEKANWMLGATIAT